MISIRPAVEADAALIFGFIRELARYERLLDAMVSTEAEIAAELFGPNPRAFCDIAEWDGAPAGFALWFYNYSTFRGRCGIYLEDLFVRPEHRGKGTGKALLRHLARRCADQGLARLEWAVLDWNAPSIAFYEGLGARPNEGWSVYRLTDQALDALAKPEETTCSS
jgi:GNAT superfamily N-acetyltransferase